MGSKGTELDFPRRGGEFGIQVTSLQDLGED